MEKQDKLERFIQQHRQDFDTEVPSFELWHKIEKQVQATPPPSGGVIRQMGARFYRIAAAVAILIMAAGWGGHYLGQRSMQATSQDILVEIAPDFPELSAYYKQTINAKYQRLVSMPHDDVIIEDLAQIDQAMQELKDELAEAPREKAAEIVNNMIQNYRIKVQILERVLERLEAGEQEKLDDNTTKNETSI